MADEEDDEEPGELGEEVILTVGGGTKVLAVSPDDDPGDGVVEAAELQDRMEEFEAELGRFFGGFGRAFPHDDKEWA